MARVAGLEIEIIGSSSISSASIYYTTLYQNTIVEVIIYYTVAIGLPLAIHAKGFAAVRWQVLMAWQQRTCLCCSPWWPQESCSQKSWLSASCPQFGNHCCASHRRVYCVYFAMLQDIIHVVLCYVIFLLIRIIASEISLSMLRLHCPLRFPTAQFLGASRFVWVPNPLLLPPFAVAGRFRVGTASLCNSWINN